VTGRYEEPTTRHDGAWQPPAAGHEPDAAAPVGPPSGPHPVPNYGESTGEADTTATTQFPPVRTTPAHHAGHPGGPQHIEPQPMYTDPSASGGFAVPQPDGVGPYYGDPTVDPAYHAGYQPGPVPQQHVDYFGGHAFPYQQQFPAGGPAQPPMPQLGPLPPGQQPPGSLSRMTAAAAHELSSTHLLKQTKRPPQTGWRRVVYRASGHTLNLGESPGDMHRRELIARINQPLRGCYKIAMLSLKGGVGKTTTTTTLGSTFASLRGDRVVAVDANPDRGTLSQKIPLETTATVRHLLRDASRITRYSDVRAYTSQGPSRLEVLASEQDPAVSEAYSEDDYRRTIDLLEHFYNIVLTDCGTGLMHSAMKGVLDIADSLVIVSSGSVDGARSASATLDWLDAHGYQDLVSRSVAVINSVRPRSGAVDLDRLAEHFGARCRAVCRIPFDPHLEEGAEIELDRLAPATRMALLELGATVADAFPSDHGFRGVHG
jgi:MinD-like ATPase involved in chromosome partitioning or flagellar assembly